MKSSSRDARGHTSCELEHYAHEAEAGLAMELDQYWVHYLNKFIIPPFPFDADRVYP